jgi:hypothetical protein
MVAAIAGGIHGSYTRRIAPLIFVALPKVVLTGNKAWKTVPVLRGGRRGRKWS